MFLKEFLQINFSNRQYYKVELSKTIECLENQDQLNEFLLDELQTKVFLLMKQKYYPKFKNYSEFHKILAKNLESVTYFSDSMHLLNKEFLAMEKTLSINHDTGNQFQITLLNIITNLSFKNFCTLSQEHFL